MSRSEQNERENSGKSVLEQKEQENEISVLKQNEQENSGISVLKKESGGYGPQTAPPKGLRIWGKRILTGILVLFWMFLIGSFSAQTGGESGNLSTKAADKVVLVEEWVKGKTYPAAERRMKIQKMQFPIRKLAHMTEYACLALLLIWHLGTYPAVNKRSPFRFPLALGIVVLYAATDEFHQRFVPGRSGQLKDVCIDGMGALAGVLVCWGFWKLKNRDRKNR